MSEEFAIHDRRLFSQNGQLKDQPGQSSVDQSSVDQPSVDQPSVDQPAVDQPSVDQPAVDQPSAEQPAAERPAAGPRSEGARPLNLPPPTFPSLLAGLAASALSHLGENQEPGAGPPEIDLAAAKQAIDLLAVLKVKTRGNLESEEESLLEALLYDLRLKYVKAGQ